MFEYRNEVFDMPGMRSKLNGKDMYLLDDMINKRAAEGWELVSTSYSVAGFPQVLLTFKKEK